MRRAARRPKGRRGSKGHREATEDSAEGGRKGREGLAPQRQGGQKRSKSEKKRGTKGAIKKRRKKTGDGKTLKVKGSERLLRAARAGQSTDPITITSSLSGQTYSCGGASPSRPASPLFSPDTRRQDTTLTRRVDKALLPPPLFLSTAPC